MRRKRMIKLLMSQGISRNEAVVYANACSGAMPHDLMGFCVTVSPEIQEMVRPMLAQIMQGTCFKVGLAVSNSDTRRE